MHLCNVAITIQVNEMQYPREDIVVVVEERHSQ